MPNETQSIERISGKYLWRSIKEAFDLERGLIFTFRVLTIRPGIAVKKYLRGERSLINPIKYAVLAITFSFTSAFLYSNFSPASTGVEQGELKEQLSFYFTYIVGAIGVAVAIFLINRKSGFNFFECLVIVIYLSAHVNIILITYSFLSLALYLISGNIAFLHSNEIEMIIPMVFVLAYFFWAFKTVLSISFFRTFMTLVFSFIASFLAVFINRNFFTPLMINNNTEAGITVDLPEQEKALYEGNTLLTWKTTLEVDSVFLNGPAWKAGIIKGDTILNVDSKKTNWFVFSGQIAQFQPGETVIFTIQRDGLKREVPITLMHADSLFSMTE